MNSFLKNIAKMFAGNAISLLSGVLVGFLVPAMMGLSDYGNYKIYTLYLVYVSLLTLGFGDGINLRYAGTDRDDLDKNQLAYYVRCYYKQLSIFFCLLLVCTLLFLDDEYKFIGCAL